MPNQLELKLTIIALVWILLILIRVWLQSEKANAWAYKEFHKEPRLPDRFPRPSTLRKFFLNLFNIHHSN